MALYLNQIKTCAQYVFFVSVWATAANRPANPVGFYKKQRVTEQTKAFVYLLWFYGHLSMAA
jgi:hypothetical protein